MNIFELEDDWKDGYVTKHVPLVVNSNTDGTDKTEIGTAEVDEIPNGDLMVNLTITNPEVAKLLGGTEMRGIIPGPHPMTDDKWKDKE